ncbi:pentatricopeptide repeat-containing protein [Forsythia ovata]|uniref:Pentatricopeptide repeat-containing protein n=1 Tax=Forsythia ovata TaxID=205694 RepID=A0ABD1V1E1_9LAMI
MGKPPLFFTNLRLRKSLKPVQNANPQIRIPNRNHCINRTDGKYEEFGSNSQNPDVFLAQQISKFIQTRPRWEQTLLSDIPGVNFMDPKVYNEVLKQQKNVLLSVRFFNWVRLVEAKAARATKCFLEETMFEPETGCLESYIECLFENELVEEALDVFEQLKMTGHCVSLKTWNSTMLQSVKAKRVDVVWKLYGDMLEYDVVGDLEGRAAMLEIMV